LADADTHVAARAGGMKKVVTVVRFDLAKRESVVEDSHMLSPLDRKRCGRHTLPVTAGV
jgi:hypothetical protein